MINYLIIVVALLIGLVAGYFIALLGVSVGIASQEYKKEHDNEGESK